MENVLPAVGFMVFLIVAVAMVTFHFSRAESISEPMGRRE